MSEDHYYLTVSPDKRKDGGYIAVISLGQPSFGDQHVSICAVTVIDDKKRAKKWFDRMMKARPWEEVDD